MPTYQYRCKDCSNDFEIFQSFTDEALTECPTCEGALKKVYGSVGISFKGSGFYKNDARSGSKSSSNGSGSKSESTKGTSSSSTESSTSSSDKSADKSSDTSKSTTSSDAAPTKAGAAASSD